MQQGTLERRSLIDMIGASVVALLVVGFAFLVLGGFGLGGGRYSLVTFVGVLAFILWALWHMVGSNQSVSWYCPSCDPRD